MINEASENADLAKKIESSVEKKPEISVVSESVQKFRNALIQHGDGNTVDEENIVVLKRCNSPQPEDGGSVDGAVADMPPEYIWFDYDFPEVTIQDVTDEVCFVSLCLCFSKTFLDYM